MGSVLVHGHWRVVLVAPEKCPQRVGFRCGEAQMWPQCTASMCAFDYSCKCTAQEMTHRECKRGEGPDRGSRNPDKKSRGPCTCLLLSLTTVGAQAACTPRPHRHQLGLDKAHQRQTVAASVRVEIRGIVRTTHWHRSQCLITPSHLILLHL